MSKQKIKSLKPPAFCWDCQYNIAYLTDNRCPECGRVFDPNRKTSYLTNLINPKHPSFNILFIVFCTIATLVVMVPYLNVLNIVLLFATIIATVAAFMDDDHSYRTTSIFALIYNLMLTILALFILYKLSSL
ncbi:hypothetical protein JD969_10010 [Planctomycetota bacterium]|nr:hypothetical protein JD969_10010 [Planctomycetota bacterium]